MSDRLPKKVKVTKASKDVYWYADHIGEVFSVRDAVIEHDGLNYMVMQPTGGVSQILASDCQAIYEEEKPLPKRVPKQIRTIGDWWYRTGEIFDVIEDKPDWQQYVVRNPKGRDDLVHYQDAEPVWGEEKPTESTSDPYKVQVDGNHYKGLAIQPAHFCHVNNIGFLAGNVIKYVTRFKEKNGRKDLEKAKHYIDMLIAEEYPEITTSISEHARKEEK